MSSTSPLLIARSALTVALTLAACTGSSPRAPQPHPPPAAVQSPPSARSAPVADSAFISASRTPFGPVDLCPPPPDRPSPAWIIDRTQKGAQQSIVDHLEADLDGDGEPEIVAIHAHPSGQGGRRGSGDIVVSIADQLHWVRSGTYEGAHVVDLDPTAPGRELIVDGSFDGAVLTYRDGRIGRLHGESKILPQRKRRPDERVTFGRLGDEIAVLVEVAGETLRARFPAHACAPTLGVIGIDRELDPSGRHRDWHVQIGDHHDTGRDGSQFSTHLVVSHGPDGLRAAGPFIAANTVEVTGPGTLEVTHWDCGVLHEETWRRAGGGTFARTARRRTGQHEPALCGRVQLLEADLDGDGAGERIVVRDGAVAVGPHLIRRGALGSRLTGRIVDIDAGDRRKELLVHHEADEDWDASVVYVFDGAALHETPPIVSRLEIDGDGDVQATVGDCGSPIHHQTWALSGTRLRKTAEVVQKATPPDQCSACPFVDVERDGRWRRAGEILRELRRPALEAWQPLALPSVAGGATLRIRLSEEKPETTYLDAIHLSIDGAPVRPVTCQAARPPAYCESDGAYAVLPAGSELVLEFQLPATPGRPHLELWAEGHYLPHGGR